MPQATMRTDLLQPLQILAQLAVHAVGQDLAVLAVHDVALAIEEPGRDFVLGGVLDDGDDAFEFFAGEFAGAVKMESVSGGVRCGGGGTGGERTAY